MNTNFKTRFFKVFFFTALISGIQSISAQGTANQKLLWQIGKPDKSNSDLALAPNHADQYTEDGIFIVGSSNAAKDWPYVHPGPSDRWAESKEHTFYIYFGLSKTDKQGQCTLQFDLIDTHSAYPPVLSININGKDHEQKLPKGGGDESLDGDLSKAKNYSFTIPFPSKDLSIGNNKITITSKSGSWFLYDFVGLYAPKALKLCGLKEEFKIMDGKSMPCLYKQKDKQLEPFILKVFYAGDSTKAKVNITGNEPAVIKLKAGINELEIPVIAVSKNTQADFSIEFKGKIVASQQFTIEPPQKMTVYILTHSHTDIGYTDVQPAIEEKQMQNLVKGMAIAKKTADYPYGARFVWNVEVAWAADLYMKRMNEAQRNDLCEAVKKGQVALNGMYLNELTGLCRPEELIHLFKFSTDLEKKCGVTIDAAMSSDVPGQTWGTVTAMAQAGIKYYSSAPNYNDRIGTILSTCEDKPFYWVSPSGNEKVLVWVPFKGYAMSHNVPKLAGSFVYDYFKQLSKTDYPYDIIYIRWSGHGDNALPEQQVSDFVKDWSTKYEWPKFIISSTSEAFKAFEKKYGNRLPERKGDWTPYWEDGAGSSTVETAMNRASSDRLSQAEALWAIQNPSTFPVSSFEEAWRNVLLYSEHTWGAWCSVTDPENKMTKDQWAGKQAYATQADKQSKELLNQALNFTGDVKVNSAVDVINTTSWSRTELVIVPKDISVAGDLVKDSKGNKVSSQRLSTGELAFIAKNIQPFSSQRFTIQKGKAFCDAKVTVNGATLDNQLLKLRINEKTGGIAELFLADGKDNFVNPSSGYDLNDYVFLPGDKLTDLQKNGQVKITVKEQGPLVASILIESDAPACKKLTRELRLTAGLDYVELINTLDKTKAIATQSDNWEDAAIKNKESVNFAFPFNVKNGTMRLDVPFGVMQPEKDQIPGACKNWLTDSRWVDVSDNELGITLATLDAPLIEAGGITANMLGAKADPELWRKHIEPTQTLFSWALNNHWYTNYRAYQEGLITFRYVLRPHKQFAADAAARFATGFTQPLIVKQASDKSKTTKPAGTCFTVQPENIIVSAFKPTDDGKGWLITLYNCSDKAAKAKIVWNTITPKKCWLSNTTENPVKETGNEFDVPAWDVVVIRADL